MTEDTDLRKFVLLMQKAIAERETAIDMSNRKGLDREKYMENVGRLRELAEVKGVIRDTLKNYRKMEADDDV